MSGSFADRQSGARHSQRVRMPLPRRSLFAASCLLFLLASLVAAPERLDAADSVAQAPRVRQVSLSGGSWSPKFIKHLKKSGKGAGGYALRSGKQLLTPLPWPVDRVSIRFTKDVSVSAEDLVVRDTSLETLKVKSFRYDPRTFTATWTLAKKIASGGLMLTLSDAVSSSDDGASLDGEFLGKFSSGDQKPGGELILPFTVLRGDVDGDGAISMLDAKAIASKLTQPPTKVGDRGYDARLDTNADGKITQADVTFVRRNVGVAIFPSSGSGDSGRGGQGDGSRGGSSGGYPAGAPGDPATGAQPGPDGGPATDPGLAGGGGGLPSSPPSEGYVPGRLIVKIAGTAQESATAALSSGGSFEELNALHGLKGIKSLIDNRPVAAASVTQTARFAADSVDDRMANTYLLEFEPTADVERLADLYAASPDVEYAEPDRYVHASLTPNDPSYSSLWAMPKIQADRAWDYAQGQNVIVAVIDTGVLYTHPDLAANMWVNPGEIPNNGRDDDGNGYIDDVRGWDFVNNDNDPIDDHSHGTHCAGTIAAAGNNGLGVIGVAYRAKIMPIKILGGDGSGSYSGIAAGIRYAASNGAHVTSNSYGGAGFSQAIADAFAFAKSRNVVNIVAAGNDNFDASFFTPANLPFPDVVTVAATTQSDVRASFSNYGSSVEVAAPGVSILSTVLNNSYASYQGTSMATPHVAGVAALYLSLNPGASAATVSNRLISTGVTPASSNIGKRVDAFAMIQQPAPAISGFSPASGTPGTQVTISGSNLSGAGSVTFNGTQASFTVGSASSITVTVPSGATTGRIQVSTSGGTATSAANFTVVQPPPPAPTISGFTPGSGPVGTRVTINGGNLSGVTQVTFNGVSASFQVISASAVSATVPAGATSGPIRVTTPGGSATGTGFVVTIPPVITSFSPSQGTENTLVTIVGSGFVPGSVPYFNGTPTNFFEIRSATTILAWVPRGATSGPLSVTNSQGSAVSSSSYTVTPPPSISGFFPAAGPVGTLVTIVGSGFSRVHSVGIGDGSTSDFTIVSDQEIRVRVPSNATTGRAAVAIPEGTSRSSAFFTVQ